MKTKGVIRGENFMRMQKTSEFHFDSFIDVERQYFKNEPFAGKQCLAGVLADQ